MHLLPFEPKILLGNFPKDTLAKIQNHTCMRIYTAVLFAVVGEKNKHLSTEDKLNIHPPME